MSSCFLNERLVWNEKQNIVGATTWQEKMFTVYYKNLMNTCIYDLKNLKKIWPKMSKYGLNMCTIALKIY